MCWSKMAGSWIGSDLVSRDARAQVGPEVTTAGIMPCVTVPCLDLDSISGILQRAIVILSYYVSTA